MSNKLKIILFNGMLIIFNIVLFSPGLIGISIHHDNVVLAGLAIAIPVIDIVTIIYVNYRLLSQTENKKDNKIEKLEGTEDYKISIKKARKRLKALTEQFDLMIKQIDEIEHKKEALLDYLKQNQLDDKFFIEEAENTEAYLFKRIKTILNKCILLDESLDETAFCEEYREEIFYINQLLSKNEIVLDKFQDFLTEVFFYKEKEIQGNTSLETTIEVLRELRKQSDFQIPSKQ